MASHMHVKRGDGGIRAGTRRIWGVGVCVEGGRRGEAGGRVPGAAAVESRVHSVATHIALIHMSRIKPKIWWGGGRRPWGLYQCLHRARPHHIFGVAPCVDTGTLVSMRSVSKYSFLPTDGPAGRFPPQSPPAERASVMISILAGGHILAAGMCPPGLQVPVARQPPASRLSWRARCSVSMVVDSVESTLTRVPRGLCCQSRKAACPKAPHTVRKGARTSLGRAVRTRTVAPQVESTPNPSSFLLRLDAAVEGLAATGLRGQTFYGGDLLCPPAMAAALATEGVESIFACGTMLTVSKVTAAS